MLNEEVCVLGGIQERFTARLVYIAEKLLFQFSLALCALTNNPFLVGSQVNLVLGHLCLRCMSWMRDINWSQNTLPMLQVIPLLNSFCDPCILLATCIWTQKTMLWQIINIIKMGTCLGKCRASCKRCELFKKKENITDMSRKLLTFLTISTILFLCGGENSWMQNWFSCFCLETKGMPKNQC